MSVLWSAVNRSPSCRAGGRPSGSGSVPALQGALVVLITLQISQSGSVGQCVYRLCRALGAFVYLDFTNRCFFRLQVFFLVSPATDCDGDETVVDDSWLVEGDGDVSSFATAEGRPPQSCAQGRPWQELDDVDSAVDSSESSFLCAARIIGTS